MNNCVIRDDHSGYTNALRIPAVFWNPKVFLGFSTFLACYCPVRNLCLLPVTVNHYLRTHTHTYGYIIFITYIHTPTHARSYQDVYDVPPRSALYIRHPGIIAVGKSLQIECDSYKIWHSI